MSMTYPSMLIGCCGNHNIAAAFVLLSFQPINATAWPTPFLCRHSASPSQYLRQEVCPDPEIGFCWAYSLLSIRSNNLHNAFGVRGISRRTKHPRDYYPKPHLLTMRKSSMETP